MIKNNLNESLIKNILNIFLSGIYINKFENKIITINYDDNINYNHNYYCGFFSENFNSNFKINFLLIDLNLNNNNEDYVLICCIKNVHYIIGIIDQQDIFVKYEENVTKPLLLKTKLKLTLDLESAVDIGWTFHQDLQFEEDMMNILQKFLY